MKKSTVKIITDVLAVVAALMLVWFFLSYVNILMHNDPLTGDFMYSRYNILVWIFRTFG